MRVMQFGLMQGPTLFAVIIGFLASRPHPPAAASSITLVLALSCAHLVLALAGITASLIVPDRVFSPAKLEGKPPEVWVKAQQTATIVRMWLLEIPTLVGLVTCLQAAFGGVLPRHGIYWLNLGSPAVLLVVGIATLPTRERLVAWFERRIGTA